MDSDGGIRGLELTGFKEEIIGDVTYYVMKAGNLNIPWLTLLSQTLESMLIISILIILIILIIIIHRS